MKKNKKTILILQNEKALNHDLGNQPYQDFIEEIRYVFEGE